MTVIEKELRAGSTADRMRYLLKDIVLYGAASAIAPAVGLIAVPLLTHALTPAEYGAFELVTSYVAVAAVVGGLGQDSAFARYYYEHGDQDSRRKIIAQAFATQTVASVLIMLLFLVVGGRAREAIASIPNYWLVIFYAAVAVPAVAAFNFLRNVLKWTFLRGQYVLVSFLYSALLLAGYAILVAVLKFGTLGAIVARGAAPLAVTLGGIWLIREAGIRKPDGFLALPMIKYGLPFILLGIFSQGFRALDKAVLTHAQGLQAAAVYAVGYRVASMILILEATFNMAWGPVAFTIYKEENSGETYNVALNALTTLLCVVAACVAFASGLIVAVLAPGSYAGAAMVIKILIIGFVVQSLAGVTAVGIDLAKKTHFMLLSWGIGVAIATVLMFLLAPAFGASGVAVAVSVGLIIEGVIRTACAYAVYPLRFKIGYVVVSLSMLLAMIGAGEWLTWRRSMLIGFEMTSIFAFVAVSLVVLKNQAFERRQTV